MQFSSCSVNRPLGFMCALSMLLASGRVCRVQSVTIHRNGSRQKVGLTLCYGTPCDGFTDVFVSEVSIRLCFVFSSVDKLYSHSFEMLVFVLLPTALVV